MKQLSDTVIGVALMAVLAAYVLLNQTEVARSEAVLGEISLIMNDLEVSLRQAESSAGNIPQGAPLLTLLKDAPQTALVGKPSDPFLMPDLSETTAPRMLGGCRVDEATWSVLRYDRSAMTQVPDTWNASTVQVCLDRNGTEGPNREGYDVIWLSLSRQTSPHVTLIPVATLPPEAPRQSRSLAR